MKAIQSNIGAGAPPPSVSYRDNQAKESAVCLSSVAVVYDLN